MSGQITPASLTQEDGDDEGGSSSTRPPVLGQEHSHHDEWDGCFDKHTLEQMALKTASQPNSLDLITPTEPHHVNISNTRPDSSLSDSSATPSNERPLQLCGQSITPSSERLTDASPTHDRPSITTTNVPEFKSISTGACHERTHTLATNPFYDAKTISIQTSAAYDVSPYPSSSYDRASCMDMHHLPARTSPCFDCPASSVNICDANKSPLEFQVPGLVPVRFDCLPDSDPHADTPPWLRWALALHYLLHDVKGVTLFRKYLLLEGRQHVDALEFWFAVEGLHGQITPETVAQLVKVIYRRYFMKAQLPLDDPMRRDVARKYKSSAPQMLADLFDVAQNHVESLMRRTTYPNFLKSDIYLQYVQSMQNPDAVPTDSPSDSGGELSSGGSSGGISVRDLPPSTGGNGGPLPTVHEDSELVTDTYPAIIGVINTGQRSPMFEPPRLTKDLLLQTQKRRALEVRPKSEALAGVPPIYHAAYAGYNPVSRVDSELQSLSSHSDARTESDSMSVTDISSIDGASVQHQRAIRRRQARQARESASLNREVSSGGGHVIIPRTQRPPRDHWKPLPPNEFAKQLTEKLENVLKERDLQDQLDKKLHELCVASDGASSMTGDVATSNMPQTVTASTEAAARTLAAALKEKLQLADDNDQDILDQHVSRVWSDLTPNRSPGVMTPQGAAIVGALGPQLLRPRGVRKDRDVHSTFSTDSGNVMDFTEGSVSGITGMVKSKSMGDYSHDNDRFIRMGINRRSSSKKTLTDLTDSGVSVVSDTPPAPAASGSLITSGKDSRVISWLLESDRSTRLTQSNSVIPNSPTASRHRKGYSHSRSSSLERGSTSSNPTSITQQTTILPAASTLPISERGSGDRRRGEPSQPFIADPSMPPLPSPHTPTQLEEARRRLMEGDTSSRSRFKESSSSQSTLRRCNQTNTTSASRPYTTVILNFCDEEFPYRTRIPSAAVTLRQFKDYLPKKGSYRFFFKTASAELDNQVIQEEVSCDTDILPLWEGKIMAQVKPIE